MSVTWKGRPLPENISPAGLDQILREMGPGDPIRLYVFAQGRYDALARAFSKAGLHWKEVSVPQALRNATRDGWSPRFLQLLDRGLDRDQFRTELARLLAASPDPLTPDGRVGGETGAGHSAATPADRTIPTRVLRWLGLGLGITAILAGLIVVVAVETLVPRSRARYGDD